MTFSEYALYQPPPGFRDELLNGEIVLSPRPNRRHQDLSLRLQTILEAAVRPDYIARLDTTINLGIGEGPRPDVFVIDKERWIAADEHGGYPEGSPQLVIEVKSPSNSWPELNAKKDLFLQDPRCLTVWIVEQENGRVHTWQQGTYKAFDSGEVVPIPDPLGPAAIAVADIFDGIVN